MKSITDGGADRITESFIKLTGFDSESFHEYEIACYVKERLEALGLKVRTDTTDEKYLKAHPYSFPNIYGFLSGNKEGAPMLFSAHLDTVAPGNGKKAVITDDGKIITEGNTVLGADDISGIVSILEALETIIENNIKHPDIEVLFTVSEEPFCEGSGYFNYNIIKSRQAYVFDLNGAVGTAAIAAPSITSFEIDVKGRAAHAGFAPENGINAISIAVNSLKDIKTGRIDEETTVNFGTIMGGTGKNIVPENVKLTGEIRSLNHAKALHVAESIFEKFRINAGKAGGVAYCCRHDHIKAFRLEKSDEAVEHFWRAARECGIDKINLITTFGGSDGNHLNEHGIKTMVVACAMENVHTTNEYTTIKELKKSSELALKLMIV